jgi:hypothetical protein
MKVKTKWLSAEDDGGSDEGAEGGDAGAAAAGESHDRPAPRPARKSRLAGLADTVRRLTIRQIASESQVPVDEDLMKVLLALEDDAAVARHVEAVKKARAPRRAAAGPARSSGRQTVAAEEHRRAGNPGTAGNSGTPEVPRLTAGADREAVKRFWKG